MATFVYLKTGAQLLSMDTDANLSIKCYDNNINIAVQGTNKPPSPPMPIFDPSSPTGYRHVHTATTTESPPATTYGSPSPGIFTSEPRHKVRIVHQSPTASMTAEIEEVNDRATDSFYPMYRGYGRNSARWRYFEPNGGADFGDGGFPSVFNPYHRSYSFPSRLTELDFEEPSLRKRLGRFFARAFAKRSYGRAWK